MINTFSALLLTLIVSALTFIFGLAIAILITRQKKQEPAEPKAAPAAPAEPPSPLPLDRFQPLVRLWREKSSGQLVVEQDGKIYRAITGVPPEERKEQESAARAWLSWQDLTPVQTVVPAAQTTPEPARETTEAGNGNLPPLSVSAPPPAPKQQPVTIVEQIDAVLQEQLAQSPVVEHRIRLIEHKDFGVQVWADGVKYDGIDAITDPQVQQIVRAAAKEWERRQANKG